MRARTPRNALPMGLAAPVIAALVFALSVALAPGCGLSTQGIPGASGGGGSANKCSSDPQCDDGNACTNDRCTDEGLCENDKVADGPAGAQTAGDCKTIRCSGGSQSEVDDDADVPANDVPCKEVSCAAGAVVEKISADGSTCIDTMNHDGTCNAGVCEVSCSPSDPCPDVGPCATVACDFGTGVCVVTPLPDGIPTPNLPDVVGDCNVHVCKSGLDFAKADDSDVPVTTTDCDTEVCNNGVKSNPPVAIDNVCSTSPKGAGVCDGAGACVECNGDGQCDHSGDDPCKQTKCTGHACVLTFTPAGTPLPQGQAGDCHRFRCDGQGNAVDQVDDTDVPDDGKECTTDGCNQGTPTSTPLPQGTTCGGGVCKANGDCGCILNSDCTDPNTCILGICDCKPQSCGVQLKTCGIVSDTCFNPTLDCNTGTKNGLETDVDCGGPAAGCATRCTQGNACLAASDCVAGLFCVDGVCCNQACAGTCSACTAALKGQGADGICGAIVAGLDPGNECMQQAPSTCGTTGSCNGAGACDRYPVGSVCVAGSCNNGSQVNDDTCNAQGMCVDNGQINCAPYACVGATCKLTCVVDADCAGGNFCSSGACVAKKMNGSSCATANECAMAFCVDGVCCNNACPGTCKACSTAKKGGGTNGMCENILAGFDPDNECAGTTACEGNASCSPLNENGTPCTNKNQCATDHCEDGFCCNSGCPKCKACSAAKKGSGINGICGFIPAGTDPDTECNGGTPDCNGAGACQ